MLWILFHSPPFERYMFTHTNRERDSQPQMAFLMKYLSGTNCIQFVRNFGWVVIESIIIIVCCVQTALWMRENIYFNSSLFVICDHYNNTKLTRLHSISMCATLYRVSMNLNWLFGHKQNFGFGFSFFFFFFALSLSVCLSRQRIMAQFRTSLKWFVMPLHMPKVCGNSILST